MQKTSSNGNENIANNEMQDVEDTIQVCRRLPIVPESAHDPSLQLKNQEATGRSQLELARCGSRLG
jgi:hypothetical protein